MERRFQILNLNKPTKDHIKPNCHISAISHYFLDKVHLLLYNAAIPTKESQIIASPAIYCGNVNPGIEADELV